MVSGIFSSKIYVPHETTIEKYVLTHELIHYKHKDLWWKTLLLVAKVIHWYNPFIFLLGRELEENLEFCCDLAVIQQLDSDKKQKYALTILSTYEKDTLYGIGLNYRPKLIERRVKTMFEKKKKSVVMASLTGFTLLFVLGLASAMANQSNFKEIIDNGTTGSDGTIHMGATSSGATDGIVGIFELQDQISEMILAEFAVHSVVTIADYDTNPKVSVFIHHSNVDHSLNNTDIESLVREVMTDLEHVEIHILFE